MKKVRALRQQMVMEGLTLGSEDMCEEKGLLVTWELPQLTLCSHAARHGAGPVLTLLLEIQRVALLH